MFADLPLPLELTLRALLVLALGVGLVVLAGWLDRVAVPVVRGAFPHKVRAGAGEASVRKPRPVVAATTDLGGRARRMLAARPAAPHTPPVLTLGQALPALGLAAAVMAIAVLPYGPGLTLAPTPIDLLVVVLAIVVIALIPAIAVVPPNGAGAPGGSRGIPMRATGGITASAAVIIVSFVPAVTAAQSLSLERIAGQWDWWWLAFSIPVGVLYLLAVLDLLAATARPDRSIRGWPRAVLLFTRYALVAVLAFVGVVVFAGGWSGPWSDTVGLLWTVLKVAIALVLVLLADHLADALDAISPRVASRLDALRAILLPVTVGCVVVAAIVVVIVR